MKYILYARKSTEDDDRQILSIEAQIFELKEFAAKEKFEIVASFQEAKTAKEPVKNIGSNRHLEAERLEIDFKKPFDLLAKMTAEARGEAQSEATNSIVVLVR
ncbi:recombinase family protein [bacterium]|nr:recombinase family protein [bacterium]